MIDEDLYKIATDELNSDARKPDVWARACALASDDHDEARFLYTNLRVEEMLHKDGKQRTFSTSNQQRSTGLGNTADNDALDVENVASQSSEQPDDSFEQSLGNSEAPIVSSRAGVDSKTRPLPNNELDAFEIGDLNAPTSSPGTDALADKVVEFDDETMAELATLSVENANESSALSGITGEPNRSSEAKDNEPDSGDFVKNVFGASAATDREQILSQSQHQTASEEHASSLANEPATGSSDYPTSAPSDDQPMTASNSFDQQLHTDIGAPQFQNDEPSSIADHDATAEARHTDLAHAANGNALSEQHDAAPEYAQNPVNIATSNYADADQPDDEADRTLDMSSNLDTGLGRSFMVFNNNGSLRAVKQGVSWPALLCTFPWLLSKALLGTAIIYGFLWLVSLGGLLTTANSWINAGADASLNIKLWTGAFALLAIVSLLYIPFRYGNRWVAEKLQNRGFVYEGSVSAENKLDAVARLIRNNQENAR